MVYLHQVVGQHYCIKCNVFTISLFWVLKWCHKNLNFWNYGIRWDILKEQHLKGLLVKNLHCRENRLRDTSPVLLSDWWLHTNPSKFDLVCNVMNWVNFRRICMESSEHNAPIKINPVGGGGGGVRARGGDLTNFKIFWSNSPGWETKGQSKVSKKTPPQGKKSKQTIL